MNGGFSIDRDTKVAVSLSPNGHRTDSQQTSQYLALVMLLYQTGYLWLKQSVSMYQVICIVSVAIE